MIAKFLSAVMIILRLIWRDFTLNVDTLLWPNYHSAFCYLKLALLPGLDLLHLYNMMDYSVCMLRDVEIFEISHFHFLCYIIDSQSWNRKSVRDASYFLKNVVTISYRIAKLFVICLIINFFEKLFFFKMFFDSMLLP